MKYRKKPIVVQAQQWFKAGDHSRVENLPPFKYASIGFALGAKSNGIPPNRLGWIHILEGGHIVSPGDWIINGIHGEFYPCKPDIFESIYEPVEEGDGL